MNIKKTTGLLRAYLYLQPADSFPEGLSANGKGHIVSIFR